MSPRPSPHPRRLTVAVAAVAASAASAAALLGTAGCAVSPACAGQCGPPFRLQVDFRPGASPQAASAAMNRCAASPLVERIGRLRTIRHPGTGMPSQLRAIIYTPTMNRLTANHELTACLLRSSAVQSAAYPD
jgi:hypothetical protein